jgi:hypothetical protein
MTIDGVDKPFESKKDQDEKILLEELHPNALNKGYPLFTKSFT